MKHNLMLACNDFEILKSIAPEISSEFSLMALDELELLAFDFSPMTLEELVLQFGKDFLLKKLSKSAVSQCDFEETLFLTHFETLFCLDDVKKVQDNDLIVSIYIENAAPQNDLGGVFNSKFDADAIQKLQQISDIFLVADQNPFHNNFNQSLVGQIIEKIKSFYGIA